MIDAVVVDLAGVAARFQPERRLAALAALSGVSEAEIRAQLFDSGFEAQAERGIHSSGQVFRTLESLLGVVPHEALVEAWAGAFEANDEVLTLVARIPAPRALFTNSGPIMDACLAGPLQPIAAPFTKLICSWHLNAAKPEPAAFERAAGLLGCLPGRLLLLDDSAANVEAARRAGWTAERVTGADEVTRALETRMQLR